MRNSARRQTSIRRKLYGGRKIHERLQSQKK